MRSSNTHVCTRAPAAIALAITLALGACSKSEPEKAQARPATPGPVAQAPEGAGTAAGGYEPGEALKERLARQEAAARLLDAPKPQPARTPEPPKAAAPVKAAEPAKEAQPPRAAAVAAAKDSSARGPEPVAAPAPSQPPPAAVKSEPTRVEPPPAPRTEVAAAKPAPAAGVARLVQRIEPDFPREAIQAGEDKGVVQARMTLDERGNVTRVEVLESHPRRLFDRSVIRALSQWKYNDGAAGRLVDIEIAFRK